MPKIAVLLTLFPVTKIGRSQQLYTLFASEGAEGIAFMKAIANFFDTSNGALRSYLMHMTEVTAFVVEQCTISSMSTLHFQPLV